MNITLSQDVILQPLEGEAILLGLDGEAYYGLDGVGMRLWELLSANGNFEAALAQLLQEFDVTEIALRQELLELLNDMADAGLVALEAND
jgi:hypothetical protein